MRGADVDEGCGSGCWINPLHGPLALENVDLCSSPLLITYHKSDMICGICGCTCKCAFLGLECNKKCQSFCRSCSDHKGTRAPDCSCGPFNQMRSLPPIIIQLGAVQRARGRGGHCKEQNGDARKQSKMGMKREAKASVRWEKNCSKDGEGLYRKKRIRKKTRG